MAAITVVSCGAGVQSTTIMLLAEEGALTPRPDAAIFADTGWEPPDVYEQVDRLADAVSFPLLRVQQGDIRADALDPSHRFASIPYYTQRPPGPCQACDGADPDCGRCRGTGMDDGRGIGRRQCTSEYKLRPITRKIRELLGAHPPDFRSVPKGSRCVQWVGFSTDEIRRVNPKRDSQGVRYLATRYPLIELGWSRKDCLRYLRERGWGHTGRSACVGCPYHTNREWREMRDHHPDQWAQAVEFDAAIRKGGSNGLPLDGKAFLHASRVPLPLAPIDHVTRNEWASRQTNIFDDLEDDAPPFGCSPFGCHDEPEGVG